MTFDLKYFLLRPTLRQRWAYAYLIAHGQRFLSDFGYENAYAMARAQWVASGRRRWRLQ